MKMKCKLFPADCNKKELQRSNYLLGKSSENECSLILKDTKESCSWLFKANHAWGSRTEGRMRTTLHFWSIIKYSCFEFMQIHSDESTLTMNAKNLFENVSAHQTYSFRQKDTNFVLLFLNNSVFFSLDFNLG